MLGLSTDSPEQALAAIRLPKGIPSYFAIGPIFATQTKPDYIPVGPELVRYVVQQEPTIPFFCIGDTNRINIPQVRDDGGSHVATVSDVLNAPDTANAVQQSIALIGA